MKIAFEKSTGKIVGYASGSKTDFSYCDSKEYGIKAVSEDKLPDRIEACKWNGKEIVVDKTLKKEVENEAKKRKIIEKKKIEILEKQAIQEAINEGLLDEDENVIN